MDCEAKETAVSHKTKKAAESLAKKKFDKKYKAESAQVTVTNRKTRTSQTPAAEKSTKIPKTPKKRT